MSGSSPAIDVGPWRNNPVLVQLLGLSPALAMTRSLATALGLGIATLAVLAVSRTAMALVERRISAAVRIPAQLLLIATGAGCVDLLLQAYRYPLHEQLSIFVLLIAANGALLAGERPQSPALAARATLATGLGFLGALCLIGALRELLAQGTLGAGMELLFGPVAASWRIQMLPAGYGFPLWSLPAGAFLLVGVLIALRNAVALRACPPPSDLPIPASGARRVRVTDPAPGD